jgi:hypothetical protein
MVSSVEPYLQTANEKGKTAECCYESRVFRVLCQLEMAGDYTYVAYLRTEQRRWQALSGLHYVWMWVAERMNETYSNEDMKKYFSPGKTGDSGQLTCKRDL